MRKFRSILGLLICITLMTTMVSCGEKTDKTKVNSLIKETPQIYREILGGFETKDINGNKVNDSIIKKQKYTLVSLWGSDCIACIDQMPILEKLNKKYKNKNFGVMGVVIDTTNDQGEIDSSKVASAKEIAGKTKITYPNIIIPGSVKETVLKDIIALPVCFIVDANGNVVSELISGSYSYKEWTNKLKEILV